MSLPFFNDAVTVPVDVQQSSQRLWGLRLVNTTGATAYLQIFNRAAAAVVLGTTVPTWVVRLGSNESLVWTFYEAVDLGSGGPGRGLSVAGTTTPNGLVAAAISVGALTG